MSGDIRAQKKHERETEAYKAFLIIAKRLQKIEYDKKWAIRPDPSDPLRKFIIEHETPWFTLKLTLEAKEMRHRVYTGNWEESYDYRFFIGFQGLYADRRGDITLMSSLEVRPRVVKKLIACINDTLVPKLYEDIMKHDKEWDHFHNKEKYFQENLAKLGIDGKNLTSTMNPDISYNLANNPKIQVIAEANEVKIKGTMTYERFAQIAKVCGWIK